MIITNRKAKRDYEVLETYEAGMVLEGTEVKSLRQGRANLKDSFARVERGEVFLHNMHISPYPNASRFNHDPDRKRKLLLHRWEIKRLLGKTAEKGFTLVPLKVYFKGKVAKVELGLCKGKKLYDKRREIAEREAKRDLERRLKQGYD